MKNSKIILLMLKSRIQKYGEKESKCKYEWICIQFDVKSTKKQKTTRNVNLIKNTRISHVRAGSTNFSESNIFRFFVCVLHIFLSS